VRKWFRSHTKKTNHSNNYIMKTMTTLLALLAATALSFSQGTLNFANGNPTLISAGGLPMPVYGTQPFIFAVFIAPSTTVNGNGQNWPFWSSLEFQTAGAYTTNSPTTPGRINLRSNVDVGGTAGSSFDYLVRGWSADAGGDWATALANWNNGSLLVSNPYFGESVVGNDLLLGNGTSIAPTTIFGLTPVQIPGFDMVTIPEPSTLAIAGLGAVALRLFRRR
jgi:hypothetical protein